MLPSYVAIAEAAAALSDARNAWLNPAGASVPLLKERNLTALCNLSPTWLTDLRSKLDYAVFAAYGWSPEAHEGELLSNLLELNHSRTPAADVAEDEEDELEEED